MKSLYDRAHGTLEGLSAPVGTIGDVAPQGLSDLGVVDDLSPVGEALGESEAGAIDETLQDLDPQDVEQTLQPQAGESPDQGQPQMQQPPEQQLRICA